MGASLSLLDQPNTEVEYTVGKHNNIKFTAAEMQGWRLNMVSQYVAVSDRACDRKTRTSQTSSSPTNSACSAYSTAMAEGRSPISLDCTLGTF